MKKFISLLLAFVISCCFFCSCEISSNVVKDVAKDLDDQTVNIIKPTVTFVTNGGSEVKTQTTNVIKTAPQTSKENYLFDGWYLDEDFKALAVFPLSVEYDTTLYAKWLKIYDTASCKNCTISGNQDFPSSTSYDVSPPNFDFSGLDERNLLLQITVTYKVKYRKDYNVPFDIGYAGSPKYEVYLLGEDLKGAFKENLPTSTSSQSRSIEMCTEASYFENNIIELTFSTDNIQNSIYISDIEITYKCGKQSE